MFCWGMEGWWCWRREGKATWATRKEGPGCIQRTASSLEVADEATESFKWTTSLEVLLLTAYGHVWVPDEDFGLSYKEWGIVEGFQAEKIYSSSWRRNIGKKILFLMWLISVSWVWLFYKKKNIQRKISIWSRTWKSNTDLISRSSCAHIVVMCPQTSHLPTKS